MWLFFVIMLTTHLKLIAEKYWQQIIFFVWANIKGSFWTVIDFNAMNFSTSVNSKFCLSRQCLHLAITHRYVFVLDGMMTSKCSYTYLRIELFQGHCVMFLCKMLNCHSASLHPGVLMGSCTLNSGGNLAYGLASHPRRSKSAPSFFRLLKLG